MQPRSDSLFHFTRSVEFLKGILQTGFKPRYSLEDSDLLGIEYTGFPMSCFCDIPLSRILEHTAFYGEYGLGMTKEWGQRNALHPVIYAVPGAIVAESIRDAIASTEEQSRDSKKLKDFKFEIASDLFQIIPFIKPVVGKMIVAGKIIDKDFSQENEWRFVPEPHEFLFKENFEKEKPGLDEKVAESALHFTPNDVRYIFVKSDHEIPMIFDFIQTQLGRFPMNDVKIMTSRIVSLETLVRDL